MSDLTIIPKLNATGAALQMMNTLSSGGTVALNKLQAAFTLLTPAQIANMAAINGLSKEWLEGVLTLMKYDDELKKEILTQYSAAQASGIHAGANNTLAFSFKNLWTVMKANPLILIISLTTLLWPLISKISDGLITTAEEAREAFDDITAECQNTESELSSLASELDEVKTRIEELEKLSKVGRLTPDQAAELKDLKATNEELQRQYDINKKILAAQQTKRESAALESYSRTKYFVTEEVESAAGGMMETTVSVNGIEYLNKLMDSMDEVKSKQEAVTAAYEAGEMTYEQYQDRIQALNAEYTNYNELAANTVLDLQAVSDGIISTSGAAYEQKQVIDEAIDSWALYDASATEAIAHIRKAATTEIMLAADSIIAMRDAGDLFSDASYDAAIEIFTDKFGDYIDTAIEAGVISGKTKSEIEKLVAVLAEVKSFEGINLFTPDLTSHIDQLKTVEENIGDLSDALADFRDNGIVTADTFVDLAETFGGFAEFEKFVNVAGDSKSTMSEVKDAVNELAEAYLNSTEFLSNMTDGTTDATISLLKNMGVSNAETVVMQRVAVAKLEAKLEADDLADAEWDEVKAHLEAAEASATEIGYLQSLRTEKLKSKVATQNFLTASASTVSALLNEAKAAGVATENLAALLELKTASDSDMFKGLTFSERTEKLNSIVAKVKADIDSISTSFSGVDLDIKPVAGSGKTAAEEAAERARNAFEEVYNAKKHELDMERITIKEFYDWLGGQDGYQKYFKAQGETLEDFRKYSKEVFCQTDLQ